MSLCSICPRPGRCCTGFYLNGGDVCRGKTALEATAEAAERGMPFLPFWQNAAGLWKWWCINLTRDGRCGDYENRPQLCRDYQPGTDKLCALRTNAITEGLHIPQITHGRDATLPVTRTAKALT